MADFSSRRGELLRRELGREPSRVRRFAAPLYVLMGLAGLALMVSAPNPSLEPVVLGFSSFAVGLLLSGVADLSVGGSPKTRAILRLGGFALGVVGVVTFILSPVFAGG